MFKKNLLAAFGIFLFINSHAQGVSVNNTNTPADASALLDVSGAKGVLIPRLSTADRDLIGTPATALLIYNMDVKSFQVNIGSPVQPIWKNIVSLDENKTESQSYWLTTGNQNAGANAFIGNADNKPLTFKTNNTARLYIDSATSKVGIGTTDPKVALHVNATDAMIVPVGTTEQRPATPVLGMIRFNSNTGKLEGYTSGGWVTLN